MGKVQAVTGHFVYSSSDHIPQFWLIIVEMKCYKKIYISIYLTNCPLTGNKYGGGNVVCPRPVPDWQKGISNFFPKSPMGKGKENHEPDIVGLGGGCGAGR